ncbi:MAG: transglutaminase family protein [Patescibacteria group bacterium]|nr:transglutaminase family protein [Patescibacteria group bacterium]
MRKFCLIIITLFLAAFPFALRSAFAYGNFQKTIKANYTVYKTGITHVSLNIALTNASSKFFALSYSINPGISDIENLSAESSKGTVNPSLINGKNGRQILINFKSRVVGFGKTQSFNVSFDTKEVAKKEGRVWEITIPGLPASNDYSNFEASITVPSSFGLPSYIKPQSAYQDLTYKNDTFIFSKNQLGHSGISMGFGKRQIYSFSLSYSLKNNNLFPITESIALPPDTNYQTVSIKSISEKPVNVTTDKDGNWLASYNLSALEKKNIVVKGEAEVFLNPKITNQTNLSDYLKSDPNWQSDNPEILKIAKKLKTAEAIYDYVVNTLHYDFSRVRENKTRLGALNALKNPKGAVCLEFTDLFIALSRSAGIPAREIDGFAYTTNERKKPSLQVEDVLHAWPEYYDFSKKTWIMVDPTWGNTTNGIDYFHIMDLDHLAFVIKGERSDYPIPAGEYKSRTASGTKDIVVGFADSFSRTPPRFTLRANIAGQSLSEIPIQNSITIENNSSILLKPQTINIKSDLLLPHEQKLISGDIPPYGSSVIFFSLDSPSFLTNSKSQVKITTAGKTFIYSIKISPFNLTLAFIGGGFFAILAGVLSFIAVRTRHLSIFR